MSSESKHVLGSWLLVPPDEWPWSWSPEGDAIVWQDGDTIVMREELALLIERLSPSGVPRIGPLVLLLVSLWMLVAMIIAVRQALDYQSTWRAVGVCVIGWVIAIAIPAILMVMTGAPDAP